MTHDPANPERDRELGAALRAALDHPSGDDAFVASVLARAAAPDRRVNETLAGWSRWGVAVAASVVIAVAMAAWPERHADASIDEALAGVNGRAMLMAEDASPGADALFPGEDAASADPEMTP